MKKKHQKHVIKFIRSLLDSFNHALDIEPTLTRAKIAAVLERAYNKHGIKRGGE